ncbi:MAG TPA: phage tail tape measure protein [Planctomycetaceae bacterium]|nr:phage tail tape measure protein [Planctomycetaceae bacterium]
MSAAGIRAGQAFVEMVGIDKASEVIDAVEAKFSRFAQGVQSTGAQLSAMGVAFVAPLAGAVTRFGQFDNAMRAAGAVAGATADELRAMTETAEHLGRTTSFTATQVGNLMSELGRGGFSPSQINEMTASVLALSRATGTDANASAQIIVESINQFGLAAADGARVADVLTLAANATNVSVYDLGESLKYAGPIAADLGMSLEETVAILGQLGNAGIKGSEAGTALRRLGAISAATGQELNDIFGISNTDTEGNLKKMPQLLDEIADATTDWPIAERVAAFEKAFGLLGMTSASVIGKAGIATQELTGRLNEAAGTAANTQAAMEAGIGGAFNFLISAADGVFLAIGKAVDGAVQPMMRAFATILGDVATFIEKNKELVVVFGTIGVAVLTAGSAFLVFGSAVKVAAFGVMGLSITASILLAIAKAAFAAAGAMVALSGIARLVSLSFGVLAIATRGVSFAWGSTIAAFKTGQLALLALRAALFGTSGAAVALGGATSVLSVASATMPIAAAVASAAYSVLGAVLSALMAPTSLLTAMGGILGSVWAAAGAIVTATWSAVIAPLLPFIAAAAAVVTVIGGVIAILAVAAARAGMFSSAWSGAMRILGEFVAIVKTTFGGIMAALQGGQYVAAVKILWAGIKAAFWTGVSEAFDTFSYLFTNSISATLNFGKQLLLVIWDIVKSIPTIFMSLLTGGMSIADIIASAFTGVLSGAMGGIKTAAADSRQELDSLIAQTKQAAKEADELKRLQDEIDAEKEAGGQKADAPATPAVAAKQAELDKLKADRAAAEQQAENDKAIRERIAALNDEAQAMRLGEDAAERLKMAQQGATAAQLAAYDAAIASREAAEVQSAVDDRIASLQDEAMEMRLGADAAERYRLQLMGATAAQLDALKLAQQQAAAAKKQGELQSAGQAMTDAMKTPLENFRDEMARIKELESAGAIDGETGRRARAKAKDSFAGEADTAEKRMKMFRDEQARIQQLVAQGRLSVEAAQGQMSAISALLQEAKNRAGAAGEQMKQIATSGTFDGFSLMRGAGNQGDTQKKILTVNERQLEENKRMRRALERERAATFQ